MSNRNRIVRRRTDPRREQHHLSPTFDALRACRAARLTPWALALALASAIPAQRQFEELTKQHLPAAGWSYFPGHAYAHGDLDGDGDQDLVAGYVPGLATATRLYLNDGSGIFVDSTAGRLPVDRERIHQVGLADVDGDGDLDMVLARLGQDRLYLNDGGGRFQDATAGRLPSDSTNSSGVTLTDVDGDGDPDAVVAKLFGLTDRLYLNDGTGSFTDATAGNLPGSTMDTQDIVADDVDGDGDQDLLVAIVPTGIRLYLNDGNGRFTDGTSGRLPRVAAKPTALADVDGDGDLDLVAAAGPSLFLNDGSGTFTDVSTTRLPANPAGTSCLAVGDVDSDGDEDLVFGTDRGVLLYRNDGAGSFVDATGTSLPVGGSASGSTIQQAVSVDADGDGDLDLILGAAVLGAGRAHLYFNDGAGRFTDASAEDLQPGPWNAKAIATGDVDGDGDCDIVFGTNAQDRLYSNDGTGRFADTTAARMPVDESDTRDLVLGDVDGDGDPDLVLATRGSSGRRQTGLYLNDGAGTFRNANSQMPADDSNSYAIALGDVDGDGDMDVVLGNSGQQNQLYLNDGAGTFTDVTATRMPADSDWTTDLALGDVDGDGDPDLVLATAQGQQNRLYLNDGAGTFSDVTAARLPVDSNYTAVVALGDVDGDGDSDLVFGNFYQDRLYLNDGAGSFTDVTAARMPADNTQTADIALVDFDGDGDPDLILATGNGTRGQNRYLRNDGSGRFTAATTLLPVDNDLTSGLAASDLDGDGDPDLVLANTDRCRVYRNLLRQLVTPHLLRIDRPLRLDVYARGGPWRWSDVALPFISDARARIPLPPAGVLQIDPARALALPPFVLALPDGVGTVSIAVPADPALVGITLHAQAVLVQLPDRIWFTNPTSDVVGDS